MKISDVLATRLVRQGLAEPASSAEGYRRLFGLLQPVSPVYFSCPGDPPALVHRTTLDGRALCSGWREKGEIVKGRFLGGTIGYVISEELELYANAFQRPLAKLDGSRMLVYDTLARVGPLTPRQLKEETGLLNKEIMPALHRLQEAFLVYEDQVDSDWERPWCVFSDEWPGIDVRPDRWEIAAGEVLRRFIHAHAVVDIEMIRDWSGWSVRDIRRLLQVMQAEGAIAPCSVDEWGDGWTCSGSEMPAASAAPSVFMLHRADPLVRANASELKRRFSGPEVLQYLLIDGDFLGAVCGHWRIGPHDVDDIVLDLPALEAEERQAEIIDAVAGAYHPPSHRIIGYNGQALGC